MSFRRIWPAILLLSFVPAAFAAGTTVPELRSTTFPQQGPVMGSAMRRSPQFANVAHVSSRPSCEDVQPPQALSTSSPLFAASSYGRKVKVSFIIGTDGRVHSPLILESSGVAGDWHVLQAVRTWRYRPATCNGVATETEAKIEFSSR
ncbi:MAG: TonB family protein [Candidatus Sulfotelmatobacter sp.]